MPISTIKFSSIFEPLYEIISLSFSRHSGYFFSESMKVRRLIITILPMHGNVPQKKGDSCVKQVCTAGGLCDTGHVSNCAVEKVFFIPQNRNE